MNNNKSEALFVIILTVLGAITIAIGIFKFTNGDPDSILVIANGILQLVAASLLGTLRAWKRFVKGSKDIVESLIELADTVINENSKLREKINEKKRRNTGPLSD